MSTITRPFPLPSDMRKRATVSPVFKAAAAMLLSGATKPRTPLKEIFKLWPDGQSVERAYSVITRGVTSPADTSTAGWAKDLVGMGVADLGDVLGSTSTFALLTSRGLQFRFDQNGVIQCHGIAASAANAAFVVEGGPFPAMQLNFSGQVFLTPKKIGVVTAFSNESLRHSVPNLELLVRTVLSESIGLALDSALLDATAGDSTRPAGLRNGIAAGAESAIATQEQAMMADVTTLVTAVAPTAGNNPIILVASPVQAAALRLWSRPNFNFEVLSSPGLSGGVVVAIAANALVSACDPVPRFQLAPDATLHFDDTNPANIATAGAIPSGLVKSMFQDDCTGLRAILECSWGLRAASGLAWLENVLW